MENMDFLPPTAPSLVFLRETYMPYWTKLLTRCVVVSLINLYKLLVLNTYEMVILVGNASLTLCDD